MEQSDDFAWLLSHCANPTAGMRARAVAGAAVVDNVAVKMCVFTFQQQDRVVQEEEVSASLLLY